MKYMIISFSLLLFTVFVFAASTPTVINATMIQRTDNSMLVDISYDLADAESDTCTISVIVSVDAGVSFTLIPVRANLSGDIGSGIVPGNRKNIVWNIGAETYNIIGSQFRVKVCAEDDSLVHVIGGMFNNGTSNVTVSDFYIDKYELTQSGYEAVMGINPATGYGVGSNYPVYNVSWYNAIEYCNRRSINEGLTACYSYSTFGSYPPSWPTGWNTDINNHTNVSCNWDANGYRLPTEMEWWFAARGGLQVHQPNAYQFSGSDNIDEVGWIWTNWGQANYTTHTVGDLASNELGLFDMSGNVHEWVWDIRGTYPSGDQLDPHGATTGLTRVGRGGYWGGWASFCYYTFRYNNVATTTDYSIGLRLCRAAH